MNSAATEDYVHRASLNYIGSKYKLIPFINETITSFVGDLSDLALAEVFGGTGAVARFFKSRVKQVIVNDIEPYSYVLSRNYIGNHRDFAGQALIDELNALPGRAGLIFRHYCLGGETERQYFSDDNGRKIDAIRRQIETWKRDQTIDEDQYYFLLASLLESADQVANVASVYGAYLKHLKKTAQKPLHLNPARFEATATSHLVYQMDANTLVRQIEGDILYLDPPYNHRQYGANYHLLNTIALYDDFTPQGKTGLRDYVRSPYCRRDQVAAAFEELIAQANFSYIFLSYNNEGLMSVEEVEAIMANYGRYSLRTTAYQRFKADRDSNRRHKASRTEEYLHVLRK
ncbi:MAG: DNA adenine methylase [Anaerolineae bacterium]|nr:DNA adenine methylase [Anaerolineae bacterium]